MLKSGKAVPPGTAFSESGHPRLHRDDNPNPHTPPIPGLTRDLSRWLPDLQQEIPACAGMSGWYSNNPPTPAQAGILGRNTRLI